MSSDNEYHLPVFACILKGEEKTLKKIREDLQTHVGKGLIALVSSTYERKEIHLATHDQWEEYQYLKRKDPRLIGISKILSSGEGDCERDHNVDSKI